MNLLGTSQAAVYTGDEKSMATISHLIALVGLIIPFGNIFAPLVLWLVKKDVSRAVAVEAKEALNFQINATVALSVLTIAAVVLMIVLIGFLLVPVTVLLAIYALVLIIVAGVRASEGNSFRYPFIYRLIP